MNRQYECDFLQNEANIFIKSYCLPNSQRFFYSFPPFRKAFSYDCQINKTKLQINRNFMIFSEEIHGNLRQFLQKKLNSNEFAELQSFHYIGLKNKDINLRNSREISSFLFNAKNYNQTKKIDLRVCRKEFVYILYGNHFMFFDDTKSLHFINLETLSKSIIPNENSNFQPLNFCEFEGENCLGNAYLLVFHENLKKYGIFEISLNDEKPKFVQSILIPNNVFGTMKIDFFSKNFELIIFSHDFLFPCDKSKLRKNLIFLILQKFETITLFRVLIFDQESRIFINYFNFETSLSFKSLNFSISRLNNNIFFELDEKMIVLFRCNSAFEILNEKNIVNQIYYGSNPSSETKLFIKSLFCCSMVKSLCDYRNYDELSHQTKEILAKILKNPSIENILKYIVQYLVETSPKTIFYLIKYFSFLNEKQPNISQIDKIHLNIWNSMGIYQFNKNLQKKSQAKHVFLTNLTEFHELLEEMDDYNYLWFYMALKTKNYDFIRDIITFNSEFANENYSKILQKILILIISEERLTSERKN